MASEEFHKKFVRNATTISTKNVTKFKEKALGLTLFYVCDSKILACVVYCDVSKQK